MLFSNIDILLLHSTKLTVQYTQTGENNVYVRQCKFAGLCERIFSVQNQSLSGEKCFAGFKKKVYL
jgi:putative alpha-1,2-mannosidase